MSENYFKVFDASQTNMQSQTSYETESVIADGYSTGLVKSETMNKILHQATIMAAALAGVIEDAGLDATDTDLSALKTNVKAIMSGQKVYYSFESVQSGATQDTALKTILGAMAVNSTLCVAVTAANIYYPAAGYIVIRKFSSTSAMGELITTAGASYELYVADITSNVVAANWVLPTPKAHTHAFADLSGVAAASHTHAAGDVTSGTLAVARGGTGVTANPSMLVNLASTTAASVFAASPKPGVTGTLPVGNGGTGQATGGAVGTVLYGNGKAKAAVWSSLATLVSNLLTGGSISVVKSIQHLSFTTTAMGGAVALTTAVNAAKSVIVYKGGYSNTNDVVSGKLYFVSSSTSSTEVLTGSVGYVYYYLGASSGSTSKTNYITLDVVEYY